MSTDRNLLFALVAFQNAMISRENLIAATSAWLHDRLQSMEDLLRSEEFITPQQHKLLSELVGMYLEQHDGDAVRSMASVGAINSVRDDLCALGDEEVEQTLAHVSKSQQWSQVDESTFWTPPEHGQRFRILRPHAKGGLGVVNIAHDTELNREVALKEIQARYADHGNVRARFVQEAEVTGRLEHPGIVPVYGMGTREDNRPYYAMRLIRGDSLKDAINRFHRHSKTGAVGAGRHRLEMRRLLAHFISLCNTIEYAHSRGILHRDIKPSNVMLGSYGETLVVDWGLAKPIERKGEYREQEEKTLHPATSDNSTDTQMGSVVGTPAYMSPEQAAGRIDLVGLTSDVYSLGATLYYLLTGQPCLSDSDRNDIIRKAQKGDFPCPRSIRGDIPRPLESICTKAMALNPEDRYQSAAQIAADVERQLAGEPVKAHRESLSERCVRLSRLHRQWFVAGSAALLLITIGSVVAAMLIDRARQDTRRRLRQANQVRLAAQASAVREKMPQRALLLATESIESANRSGDALPRLAFEVLHATMASTSGKAVIAAGGQATFSRDGQWLIWDQHRNDWQLLPLHRENGSPLSLGDVGDCSGFGLWDTSGRQFSPDGRWLALGGKDGQISLFDLQSTDPGSSLRRWKAHNGAANPIIFAGDSGRLITASADDDCKVWDLSKPRLPREVARLPSGCQKIATSTGGRYAAICDGSSLHLWDIESKKPVCKLSLNLNTNGTISLHDIAFSPNGRFLAASNANANIWLWDLEQTSPAKSEVKLGQHNDGIVGLVFTADGQQLISWSTDGTARIFFTGTPRRELVLRGHQAAIYCAAISPSGLSLATGGNDHTIRVWNLASPDPNDNAVVLRGHDAAISSLAFSPDGEVLYSSSWDDSIRSWSLQQSLSSRRMIRVSEEQLFGGGFLTRSATSENGFLIAKLPSGEWRRWNVDVSDLQGETLSIPRDREFLSLKASNDGRWLLSSTHLPAPALIDLDAPGDARIIELKRHQGPVDAAFFDPKSEYVVTIGSDNLVLRWDLAADNPHENPQSIAELSTDVVIATISSDGHTLFAGCSDGLIRRWDLGARDPAATEFVYRGHEGPISRLAASADGRWLASSSGDAVLRIWQQHSGQPAGTLPVTLHEGVAMHSLSFSPDGRYFVASERAIESGVVHIWDMSSANIVNTHREFRGHILRVSRITFSSDSRFIASGDMNGGVLVWDVTKTAPEASSLRLTGHADPIFGLRFFDEDRRLISVGFDATARVWDIDNARLLKRAQAVAGRHLTDEERQLYGLATGDRQ